MEFKIPKEDLDAINSFEETNKFLPKNDWYTDEIHEYVKVLREKRHWTWELITRYFKEHKNLSRNRSTWNAKYHEKEVLSK